MSPSFDHPSNAIMSLSRWQCIGLFTASLALTFVVAGSINILGHHQIAVPSTKPDPVQVNIQLSSDDTSTFDTGSGDPSGTEEFPTLNQISPVEEIAELDAAPLPDIPSLTDLPDIPAPEPDIPPSQSESPSTNQETAPTQNNPQSPSGTTTRPSTNASNTNSGTSSSSNTGSSSGTPAVQRLQFGVGAGRQPAPSYPRRALSRGHEGIVVVQFTVSESGRVEDARAVKPTRYPELNRAALSTIRRKWKFPPGDKRIYQISINFQIR